MKPRLLVKQSKLREMEDVVEEKGGCMKKEVYQGSLFSTHGLMSDLAKVSKKSLKPLATPFTDLGISKAHTGRQ